MFVDDAKLYGKLEELAVSQATIIATQESEHRSNKDSHGQMIAHLQITNGDIAELRRDFDEKAIVDAADKGRLQGTLDTLRIMVVVIVAITTVAASVTGITFGVLQFL